MPGWMANNVGLYGASGMTGLEQVNARVSSKRGVFAEASSASFEGSSETLRKYISLSAVLGALRVEGKSGVIFFVIETLLKQQPLSRRCAPLLNSGLQTPYR